MSTAVVGLAGIAATYQAGVNQSKATLQAQREERTQRRIETSYENLRALLVEGRLWLDAIDRFASGLDDKNPGPLPDTVRQLVDKGSVEILWSPRVVQLVRPWIAILGPLTGYARTAVDNRAMDVVPGLEDVREGRNRLWNAEVVIVEQVHHELLGEHDGHPEAEPTSPKKS